MDNFRLFPSIIKLKGGLGNQLFQYSFGKFLEVRYGQRVFYDCRGLNFSLVPRDFGLSKFYLFQKDSDKFIFDSGISSNIWPKFMDYFYKYSRKIYSDEINSYSYSGRFEGYWQRVEFFQYLKDTHKNFFSINKDYKLSFSIIDPKFESVGIHIRGTDYFNHNQYVILDKNYYLQAIRIIIGQVSNPCFFIFTDDPDYAKKLLPDFLFPYIKSNSDFDDFCLLKSCKHQIISNSTFSWWAAMLNMNPSKLVVSPKCWFKDSSNPLFVNSWNYI